MFSQIAATKLVEGLRNGEQWQFVAADMIEEMQSIIHDYTMQLEGINKLCDDVMQRIEKK
jgi:hypothetical protein